MTAYTVKMEIIEGQHYPIFQVLANGEAIAEFESAASAWDYKELRESMDRMQKGR